MFQILKYLTLTRSSACAHSSRWALGVMLHSMKNLWRAKHELCDSFFLAGKQKEATK